MQPMELNERAALHAALGDPARLRMVEELLLSDRTFRELAEAAGLAGNAAAHHLAVLEEAGLISRRRSDGDRRRRYVQLRPERLHGLMVPPAIDAESVLFICTHNSARSQFAAALWQRRTGRGAASAGSQPASRVHPRAVETAADYGLDLHRAVPRGYESVAERPDLVVSVCDLAHEAAPGFRAPMLHWSVPDPVARGTTAAFRSAFAEIAERVEALEAITTAGRTH